MGGITCIQRFNEELSVPNANKVFQISLTENHHLSISQSYATIRFKGIQGVWMHLWVKSCAKFVIHIHKLELCNCTYWGDDFVICLSVLFMRKLTL